MSKTISGNIAHALADLQKDLRENGEVTLDQFIEGVLLFTCAATSACAKNISAGETVVEATIGDISVTLTKVA